MAPSRYLYQSYRLSRIEDLREFSAGTDARAALRPVLGRTLAAHLISENEQDQARGTAHLYVCFSGFVATLELDCTQLRCEPTLRETLARMPAFAASEMHMDVHFTRHCILGYSGKRKSAGSKCVRPHTLGAVRRIVGLGLSAIPIHSAKSSIHRTRNGIKNNYRRRHCVLS